MNQTYQNLEIILVDDGSPDQSGKICDEVAKTDSRIKVIHQKNKGLSGARNSGIDIATGDYIGFVDSDDYIDENMYECLYQKCIDHNCDIAISKIHRFSGDWANQEEMKNAEDLILTSQEALKQLHGFEGQQFTVAWNKLYKKELFDGLRYPQGKINEDEFLTYKLLERAKQIVVTDEVSYYYFQNGDSITTNEKYLTNKDIFKALEERKSYFQQADNKEMIPLIDRAYLDRIISRYGMLLNSGKADKADLKKMWFLYKNYYKKAKSNVRGIGYQIFSFLPQSYFMLLKIKKAFKR